MEKGSAIPVLALVLNPFEKVEIRAPGEAREGRSGARAALWKKLWESFGKSSNKFQYPLLPI
jgi:hypothetical protein